MNRYIIEDLHHIHNMTHYSYILIIACCSPDHYSLETLDTLEYVFNFHQKPSDISLSIAKYMIAHPQKFENFSDLLDDCGMPNMLSKKAEDLAEQLDHTDLGRNTHGHRLRMDICKVTNDSNSFIVD